GEQHHADLIGGAVEGTDGNHRLLLWSMLEQDDDADDAAEDQSGDADVLGHPAAPGPFFFAGVEQHDDEDEQHHDGAGVDDDLDDGDEFGAEQQVDEGQRA